MVTLLCSMAATIRALDPQHLLTVGYCWLSGSLLTQDCTDFLMPQCLGADAPNVLAVDEEVVLETAFLRTEIAGALSWVLTDFKWPLWEDLAHSAAQETRLIRPPAPSPGRLPMEAMRARRRACSASGDVVEDPFPG